MFTAGGSSRRLQKVVALLLVSMADSETRRTISLKERGIRIAKRAEGFVLDLVFPIPEQALRQREALIRYRSTPRFHDPIHGFHTDDTRVPTARVLVLTKYLNHIEMAIQYAVEEVPIHAAQRGIAAFKSRFTKTASVLDRVYRRSMEMLGLWE